jgi:hypothetical protein
MKKIIVAALFIFGAAAAKAQCSMLNFINDVPPGTTIQVYAEGNSISPSSCATGVSSGLYAPVFHGTAHFDVSLPMWSPAAPPPLAITNIRIIYTPTSEYYDLSLCGITPVIIPAVFSGGSKFDLYVGVGITGDVGVQIVP